MGAFLFIAIIFFGRWTLPLLINLIVLIFKLIGSLFTASEAAEGKRRAEPKQTEAAQTSPKKESPKREKKELPQEQKVMFCSAIIEDSFSYRDDFLSMAFDVRFEYLGKGCFAADNIQ